MLRVEDLSMNLVTREVLRAGQKIDLPMREFALLDSFSFLGARADQDATHRKRVAVAFRYRHQRRGSLYPAAAQESG